MLKNLIYLSLLVAVACNTAHRHNRVPKDQTTGWRQYGGNPAQSKFMDLRQITKANVNQLRIAWSYPTADSVQYLYNPLIIDTVMYVLAKNNSLVALHAATGKELWIHANLAGITWRGLNYWESKDKKDRRLIFCINNTLQEINAATGQSITNFGTNGYVSLKEGLGRDPGTIARVQSTTPGCVFEDLILLGSSPGENLFSAPGHVRAYNIITGKLEWVFHTIPHPGEYGYDTWPKDAYKYAGGANTWGEITVDERRGIAYFPIGSPTYDYYGADRTGSNLFGNCLLALDARTGKRLWHYQTVHHDLWDYDLTAAPQLITVRHNGRWVDAVAAATKQGFLFVFDRVTGQPLWPIEERPVPPSEMPGEHAWPTQPFPTVVPPFTRQVVKADDLNPYFTPEQKERWLKRLAAGRAGLFTPPSDKYETMIIPGATGGANLGNTAADPAKGIVYVATQDYPSVFKLEALEPSGGAMTAARNNRAQATYAQFCQSCHGESRAGGLGPSLLNLSSRVNFETFKTILATGKGQMPGFQHIDEKTVTDLYGYLTGIPGAEAARARPPRPEPVMPVGPVVAAGAVPVPKEIAERPAKPLRTYPEGVAGPQTHYVTDYGLQYSNLMSPPWASIIAYDLNTGAVKWRTPLGQDARAAKLGAKNTGIPNGSQRKGMIVTSTGLLFATAKGGKLYAFDADNGQVLWSTDLSWDTQGMPAMYAIKGKQYIVVSANAPFTEESVDRSKEPGALPRSYVVYALPE